MNILKYPGGKAYFASAIIKMMRPHETYVEPFFGSGKVFFEKEPARVSRLSDIDGSLINFWIQVRDHADILQNALKKVPYNETAFEIWRDRFDPKSHALVHALRIFVLSRMSRSGLGCDFSQSDRLRRGMPEGESSYLSAIELLAEARRVLDKPAITLATLDFKDAIVPYLDDPNALIYLDPPYMGAMAMYRFQLPEARQLELLKLITAPGVQAKIILSGYDNELYRAHLHGQWTIVKTPTVNRMAQTKTLTPREECTWRNYW